MKDSEKYREPTWADAREWMSDVVRVHSGFVAVHIYVHKTVENKPLLAIRVLWARTIQELACGGTHGVSGIWPTSEHRTMPGLVIRLATKLDAKMTQDADERERQAHF